MITVKEVKAYLQQVEKNDKLIENKIAEKKQWYELATGTSAQLSPEKVQSSGNQQRLEDAVIKIVDIEREINAQIDKLVDIKREVIATIEQLNPAEYDVLHKRYIQFMTIAEIAYALNKSETSVSTTHGRALVSVQKILNAKNVTKL